MIFEAKQRKVAVAKLTFAFIIEQKAILLPIALTKISTALPLPLPILLLIHDIIYRFFYDVVSANLDSIN